MRTAFATATREPHPVKPKGGYRIITAAVLAAAWWAYRHKFIRLVDLRVWFANHELDARRCRVEQTFPRRFNLEELRKLTGLSLKRLKESLGRLQDAKLLTWSETDLEFPDSTKNLDFGHQADFRAFLDEIPNSDRKVPVPRRTLRLIAGGARPALIATVLGHLIRGLYLKAGKCLDRGRVKASWIADVFGIGLRRVKQARHELIAIGWLIPLEADQWSLNRWGAHFRINLEWSRLDGNGLTPPQAATKSEGLPTKPEITIPRETSPGLGPEWVPPPASSGPELAPPAASSGPELAPPDSYEKPLDGSKHQKPASGPPGISISDDSDNIPRTQPVLVGKSFPPTLPTLASLVPVAQATIFQTPSPATPSANSPAPSRIPPAALGKPNLRDVVPADLKDTGRLLDLLAQAIDRNWVTSSERDRLRFVGAAEHARVIGTKNPCGLFVRLVSCGLWSFLTQDDEDAASARLKRHLYGVTPPEPSAPIPMVRKVVALSEDARLVKEIRAAVARAGYRGDAFPLWKRDHPEWTRERWDKALAELSR